MGMFGWVKQPDDIRDLDSTRYMLPHIENVPIPAKYTLPISIPVYDQGSIGSCTANSGCVCYIYEVKQKDFKNTFNPSRLFLYYNARALRGWETEDSGAYIRDVFKTLNKDGVCAESHHKYNIDKFTKKPTKSAYRDGVKHTTIKYAAVIKEVEILKRTILSEACISFGFNVYKSFQFGNWTSTTGIMPIPNKETDVKIGGHAVTATGWDDEKQAFLIQNSWGEHWGINGTFYMPYDFITSAETDDFWCIESVK